MAASLFAVGFIFHIGVTTSPHLPFITIGFLLLFIIGFAFSAGPLVWVVCSEIYPLAGRDVGVTLSTASNWICNAIVGATFLTMLNTFGNAATFWIFTGFNVLFFIVILLYTPETKGKSLEEIEENLMSGKRLRNIGK